MRPAPFVKVGLKEPLGWQNCLKHFLSLALVILPPPQNLFGCFKLSQMGKRIVVPPSLGLGILSTLCWTEKWRGSFTCLDIRLQTYHQSGSMATWAQEAERERVFVLFCIFPPYE